MLYIILVVSIIIFIFSRTRKKQQAPATGLAPGSIQLLEQEVHFYRRLSDAQKKTFERRVQDFLSRTTITGIGTEVTELDRVLVAASAIIPIFAFPDWRYNNIDEVLLYKDSFDHEYNTEEGDRPILGMVGNGAMNRQMILSQPALREGFAADDRQNTGIHEFVHLLDKADGATDGIPEYLLDKQHMVPWLRQMHAQIAAIRNGRSDINPYGATNDAEFFAVAAEYFFEKPQLLKEHHPVLYELLEQMFRTEEITEQKTKAGNA